MEDEDPAAPGVCGLPGVVEAEGAPVGAVDRPVAPAVPHLALSQDDPAGPPGPEAAGPGVVERGLLHLQLSPAVHHDTPGLQAGGRNVTASDGAPPPLAVQRRRQSGSEVISDLSWLYQRIRPHLEG